MNGNLLWLWLAIGSAGLWGLQYALWGKLVHGLTPLGGLFWYGVLSTVMYGGLMAARGLGWAPVLGDGGLETGKLVGPVVLMLLVVAALGVSANVVMMSGFALKNATAVSMIQVSYPLFTALFAWLLFRNVQLSWAMVVGLLLIVAGVGLVAVAQK